jgi:hypothetical protein
MASESLSVSAWQAFSPAFTTLITRKLPSKLTLFGAMNSRMGENLYSILPMWFVMKKTTTLVGFCVAVLNKGFAARVIAAACVI